MLKLDTKILMADLSRTFEKIVFVKSVRKRFVYIFCEIGCIGTGVVQGWAAILMGLMFCSIPWYTMMVLHKQLPFIKHVDDTMAVFHTHAFAGSLGGILTGFFAKPKLCYVFYNLGLEDAWQHYTGLAYGIRDSNYKAGFKQMGIQIMGIVYVTCINIVVTSIICLLINFVIPLQLPEDELEFGDDAIHGEEAYALWGDGKKEKFENSKNKGELQMA